MFNLSNFWGSLHFLDSPFDNEIVYWKTDDDFHKGIDISLIYRWKENIKSTLVPKLTDEQKKEFKALFD